MPPLVVLDHTLADLYYAAGVRQPLIASAYHSWAHIDTHPNWPRETVYPQDEDPDFYCRSTEEEKVRFRRAELAFRPLKGAFPLGNMEVILFANGAAQTDAKQNWGQLCPTQQPKARFLDLEKTTPEVSKALQSLVFGKSLVISYPCGWMQEARCVVDPKTAYELESKRFLIESGIRTPQLEMLSLEDPEYNSILTEKALPFVVKYPLAVSSLGTWLVMSEKVRLRMLAAVERFATRGGTEVQLSEYIVSQDSYCVQFFVGAASEKREPLFSAVTTQVFAEDGLWAGARIDYEVQAELRDTFSRTIKDTIACLPPNFIGWVGIDVLVDSQGQQWVVDLNPRMTGSMHVCLLSNFFWKKRGLQYAETGSFKFTGAPELIYDVLSASIERWEIIVTASVALDDSNDASIALLVWGASTQDDLAGICGDVRRLLDSLSCGSKLDR